LNIRKHRNACAVQCACCRNIIFMTGQESPCISFRPHVLMGVIGELRVCAPQWRVGSVLPQPLTCRGHAYKQLGLCLALFASACMAPLARAGCGDEVYHLNSQHSSTNIAADVALQAFTGTHATPPSKRTPCHGPNCSRQPVQPLPAQTVSAPSRIHDGALVCCLAFAPVEGAVDRQPTTSCHSIQLTSPLERPPRWT
jgi:hypothetical protein